jgi:hypothetical protein
MARFKAKAIVGGLLLAVLVAACGRPRAGSDPGNARLHMLRADPIFAKLPPGAHLLEPIKSEPAVYTKPSFGGGGWSGPSVTVIFHSDLPVDQVAAFYNTQAMADGWGLTGYNTGMPAYWSKTFPGGIVAYLHFFYGKALELLTTYGPGTYEISGAI